MSFLPECLPRRFRRFTPLLQALAEEVALP
jgi:hypothetical protein